ncbi:FMN-binding protein [Microbacterium betulae]|uniref:FMN-binding protein n=1 Tax=Microbacterium betulae TaxID=2981139 RepID=A0AA97FJC5_9MICO|nr:hypothetical protein [Microbacterium sp. AB]WOF24338.1 FMN-binding protein [Microbacterium sp. AB]
MNRSIRTGAALAGVAGVLALAGCGATTADDSADDTSSTTDSSTTTESPTSSSAPTTEATTEAASGSDYADGTYTAEGSYQTPQSVEEISVTVTLEDDVVTAVEVTGQPQASESQQYQSQFIGGIADEVVGLDIDELSVSRVAGSSLTSTGFNAAIEEIKTEAAV